MNESKAKHYVNQQLADIRTENKQLKNQVKALKERNKEMRKNLANAEQDIATLLREVKRKNK